MNIINNLRVAAGLPGDFQSSDPATIQAQVIQERSRELYLQGEHAYDSRRSSGSHSCRPLALRTARAAATAATDAYRSRMWSDSTTRSLSGVTT